jgi:predicted RNA methylase
MEPVHCAEYLMPLRTVTSTFARLDTQRAMLQDRARVEALARAIAAVVRPGDVVVEIGTGSGLLAVLAARAGARRVHAIEATELWQVARDVVARNGVAGVVEVHHGLSLDLELPERGDVLISETLGHLGVDEGIVTTVADARARLLTADARLLPERIDLVLALTADTVVRARELGFWRGQVQGVELEPAAAVAAQRVYLRDVREGELVCTPRCATRVELARADAPPSRLAADLTARREAEVTGVAAWFETDLGGGVRLSSRATASWFPLFFPIEPALPLRTLEPCRVVVEAIPDGDEVAWRWSVETERERRDGGRR